MLKIYFSSFIFILLTFTLLINNSCKNSTTNGSIRLFLVESNEGHDKYDGPAERMLLEYRKTQVMASGTVPRAAYLEALNQTLQVKANAPSIISAYGTWIERGPFSDAVGPSNGNTRSNNGIASGRIRAVMVDSTPGSPRMVWVGGVDGGLWKTTDITSSPANWTLVNDYLNNLAVAAICQDPTNPDIMYFATGESYFNADAVQGNGVFRSTDHGLTWTHLASTSTYVNCTRILCDYLGNIYLATRGNGVLRSTKASGGAVWTDITPTGIPGNRICDMEISTTAGPGRLHVVAGIFSTQLYRYTDIPTTVASGTWTSPTTAFPSFAMRTEIACKGNNLFALVADGSYEVPIIYKSTDGGANWAGTTGQPTAGWASGQAWYALAVDIDPSNANKCIVGGLDTWKTTNGGNSWTRISDWVGTGSQYVHADIQKIVWYDGGDKLIFACDGGIHYSSDEGATIRDRNIGLRLKQFYSVAMHPSSTNYFLGGTQDNGVHQFNSAGLGNTVEVTGGDGAFVAIDQDQPQYQVGSYVFNNYRISNNGGVSWTSANFGNSGQFINPFDYDNTNNKIYAAWDPNRFFRWDNPQTGFSASSIPITLNGNRVSAVKVSPYTSNLVYFGSDNVGGTSRLVKLANAATTPTETNITGASFPSGTISCINSGNSDNTLIACFSNYGVNNVWVSNDGGTNWTAIDGNLPDMPVRWAMFKPGDESVAIIATETGVWITSLINGASTSWITSPTFPTVRTDMLAYRASDGLVAAATHGRGVWTQKLLSILPANNFTLRGRLSDKNTATLNWENGGVSAGDRMEVEASYNGTIFTKVGTVAIQTANTTYRFNHSPAQTKVYYRIKSIGISGDVKYSNQVILTATGNSGGLEITKLYPNPVQQELNLAFHLNGQANTQFIISDMSGVRVWMKTEALQFTGNYSRNWNVSQLRPGSYVLTIIAGNERRTQKFIKR